MRKYLSCIEKYKTMDDSNSKNVTEIRINETIVLDPNKLTQEYRRSIRKSLRQKLVGTCHSKHGLIMEISDIDIASQAICDLPRGQTRFRVKLTIKRLLPEIGSNLFGVVEQILADDGGIFVIVHDTIRVIIPIDDDLLNLYKIDGESLIHRKKKHVIEPGSIVRIKLLVVKYQEKIFKCIGQLVEPKKEIKK